MNESDTVKRIMESKPEERRKIGKSKNRRMDGLMDLVLTESNICAQKGWEWGMEKAP